MKFYFLKPTAAVPVFLTLDPDEYPRLIPWTVAPSGAMVVPYVEVWHPGDLPVSAITRALVVTVEADDLDSAYRGLIRSLRRDAGRMLDTA